MTLFPIYGFAYLDPGTGSMLLYFLLSIFAMFIYYVKESYYKITSFFTKYQSNNSLKKPSSDTHIAFYSEGAHYWNVFLPIIEELERKNIKCIYYTSSKNDEGLNATHKNLTTEYIGSNMGSYLFLNNLDVAIVVMTTPQIDVMYLKRSKNVKNYIHIVHSPIDMLYYNKFAFDYFDTIMCSGYYQMDSIRALEEKRSLPPKKLLATGLTYYDVMERNKNKYLKKNEQKTILVAPTWGKKSMLTRFGIEPIILLLKEGYNIILRPHPQMYISQKELMLEIENKLLKYENIEICNRASGEYAMGMADLLISDISGIIFDFFFIYEKPLVLIEGKVQKGGFEAEDVEKEAWEITMFDKIAKVVNYDNIDTLHKIVESELSTDHSKNIALIREQALFNFGQAGKVAATQLEDILNGYRND